jgi:exodeoxyribonuclease III
MPLKVATWNINSVRLRIELVKKLLAEQNPDILCLQETKCPQGQFPAAPLRDMGYAHLAEFGQKGYHGVAIVSKLPFTASSSRDFCAKGDCRHIQVTVAGERPLTIHNLYVPSGGDEPDPKINEKFAHKLKFLDELESWFGGGALKRGHDGIVVGDLNIAPLEHDVWSHKDLLKIVSHTPIETDGLKRVQKAGKWVDVMRQHVPADQKLYTWWSYRAKDWAESNRGRRLDHIWASPGLAAKSTKLEVIAETRGWTQTSDHVPVIATFDL